MKTRLKWLWLLLLITRFASAQDTAPADESVLSALRYGEWHFSPRYRYEFVEDAAQSKFARTSTLRSRLNYRASAWRGWSAFVEADDVRSLGADLYNSTRNGKTDRPLVPDPEGTELNQATLSYSDDRYSFVLGRQRLALDDQRFIGSSSWRQNEQTLDAVTGRVRFDRVEALYSYVDNVNRVVGPDAGTPPGDLRSDSHLVNVKFAIGSLGRVSTFAYLLDFGNASELSSSTYGLRWTGTYPLTRSLGWVHDVSFAQQSDYGDNPANFNAEYWQILSGFRYRGWSALIGRDTLTGDRIFGDRSFQTPLATLHSFQGFAEKFTTKPAQGIKDTYVSLSGVWQDFNLQASFHVYTAEAASVDYGNEWNISLSRRINTRYEVLLKAADYSAEDFSTDATKLWVQIIANF